MSKKRPSLLSGTSLRMQIAQVAARMMAREGVHDYALAKRKAAAELGWDRSRDLPGNDEIEAELRSYQSLFLGEQHAQTLHALRTRALSILELFASFSARLCGAVAEGIASPHSPIEILVWADSSKALEVFLLNQNIPFTHTVTHVRDHDHALVLPALSLAVDGTLVRITVLESDRVRRLAPTWWKERYSADSLRQLLSAPATIESLA